MKHCTNPPWTEKILKKHWAALERLVGPQLMPVAETEVRGLAGKRRELAEIEESIARGSTDTYWVDRANALRVEIDLLSKKKPKGWREYGTGHYGTVMPTGTPGTVIKVTTDPTEASFVAAYLSMPMHVRPSGIIEYHRIVAIRGESHLKRPVFVLWRDEAQFLGQNGIEAWIRTRSVDQQAYYRTSLRASMRARSVRASMPRGRFGPW